HRVAERARRGVLRGVYVIGIELQWCGLGTDRAKLAKQEIRVVEHVEEFRPEFDAHPLADRKLLDQRSVPGLVSRSTDDVAASIAKSPLDGVVLERTGVEQGTGHTRACVRVAHEVGSRAIESD